MTVGGRDAVIVDMTAPVASLTFARPGKRNAMTDDMWQRVAAFFVDLEPSRDNVNAVILKGAAGAFSAGADLSEVARAAGDLATSTAYCEMVVSALHAVANSPVPTLAAVDGAAHGGGLELAIMADCRIATARSSFSLPVASLGVVPDRLTIARLLALIGPAALQWFVIGGAPLGADEALRLGLIDALVPDAAALEASERRYRASIAAAPAALVKTRVLARSLQTLPPRHGLEDAMIASFVDGTVARAAARFVGTGEPRTEGEG